MDAELSRQQVLKSDNRYWYVIVEGYLRGLGIQKEDFRNVMDMRAMYGGYEHLHILNPWFKPRYLSSSREGILYED